MKMSQLPDIPADVEIPDAPVEIEEVMISIDWSGFKPTKGDCGAFAAAMCSVFPVDSYYGAWEPGQKRHAHVAVVVESVILDATGRIDEEVMKDYAIAGVKAECLDGADWGPFATDGNLYGSLEKAVDVQNKILNKLNK